MQCEGIERDFVPGEEIHFSKDFESVAIGVSASAYLDMILDYTINGTIANRPVVFETGDYTHGVGTSS